MSTRTNTLSIEGILAEQPGFEDLHLRLVAKGVFEYTQYLLDDESNVTRVGNLTGDAKDLLQRRTLELLGAERDSGEPDGVDDGLDDGSSGEVEA